MTTINDTNVFPVELTGLDGWEDYISEFEEWELGPTSFVAILIMRSLATIWNLITLPMMRQG